MKQEAETVISLFYYNIFIRFQPLEERWGHAVQTYYPGTKEKCSENEFCNPGFQRITNDYKAVDNKENVGKIYLLNKRKYLTTERLIRSKDKQFTILMTPMIAAHKSENAVCQICPLSHKVKFETTINAAWWQVLQG